MKKINRLIFALSIAFAIFYNVSCKSNPVSPSEEQVEKTPDYTQEDVKKAEIERINMLLQTDPVQGLWRSVLLNDPENIEYASNYLRDVALASNEHKEYDKLYKEYNSLVTAGFKDKAEKIISRQELDSLYFQNIPGFGKSSNTGKKDSVSEYVDGTVTIWVDLGFKVQNGMGYADRVIGSGFFIDDRGYIITNHHVIADIVNPKYEGYGRVYIKLAHDEETRIPAKVIGWDAVHDLALLKTEVTPPYVFTLGASNNLKVGDKIYCIGSPLGLESTLTSGVVSSTDRKLFTTGSVMQIDAAINSGNSGGPCVDSNGKVQAIVFAGVLQHQGLNFAIPVEYLKQDLPFLYYGGKRGVAWVGGFGKTYRYGKTPAGLEIYYVTPGSPLARAGLKEKDVITAIDGKKVTSLETLQAIMRDYVPGMIVNCNYKTEDGTHKEALLYLNERPKYPGYTVYQSDIAANSFYPLFGIKMANTSTIFKNQYIITEVMKGSTADESGFSDNDPITVAKTQFSDEKNALFCEFLIKRRVKGYLEVSVGVGTMLDSTYYF